MRCRCSNDRRVDSGSEEGTSAAGDDCRVAVEPEISVGAHSLPGHRAFLALDLAFARYRPQANGQVEPDDLVADEEDPTD